MSVEMKIPEVGESITEVTISQWLKQDGDFVEQDDIICELESDKATFELPSDASGILKILVEEGETIEVGTIICTIEEGEGASSSKAEQKADTSSEKVEETQAASGPKETGQVKEMVVPDLAESISEVVIGEWLKENGDFVELDEEICEVETDKATQALPAEAQGILEIVAEEGATLQVGDLICRIKVMEGDAPQGGDNGQATTTTTASTTTTVSANQTYATGHPSPAAAKTLAEKGIDPATVQGTGVDGRITKEDALKAQKAQPVTEKKKDTTPPPVVAPVPGSREEVRKRLTPLRKTIARRLVSVKNETAMLTTFNEVNMKPVMDMRKKYKEQFKEKHGVGLGFMSFFVKACCEALLEVPQVNSIIDGEEMVTYQYCDVSIAVSAPKGLVVPVIRNAEAMNFAQIEGTIIQLATKARDNKLSIPEMTGGTFTITNGGIFGSMMSTPIINAPQSAILGMHNIVQRPMAVNGEVVILPMMYLALSYDHRIIDGREAVTFLVKVKERLEAPERLLLGV